ncbi:tyrosine--tRNA ligase [Ureaplasma sp. ES3154-GEN]|uniref:tyrosine--tRNA ligase n=1 Tax=Ureaplasma sp. ES3154-GEN TaxID=2984844 RepID=UPI0021E899EA|nr:tyrosine--tRNA ligase [Ureaplasma sp. ES3154-GEN]MCV3743756.1 tyrosine--tRNA ligase [Ureaplasma sp. ES3154-GEN]
MSNIITDLQARGLINNITNEEKIIKAISINKGVYVGFDPSFDSLHLGNYIMIMLLRRFHQAGFPTVAVIGGATGMIGDPSGKNKERNLLDKETLIKNIAAITSQLETYAKSKVINNFDFYAQMNFLDFLRDVGKIININYLLEKDIIASRLSTGLSYTEFSYNLLQGYDFWQLYQNHNVAIQAGGSDQWGNITTGIEMIRKIFGDDNLACGLTINLLVNKDGKKFGKSEKGAIFLSEKYTSVYEMYQFLFNQADEDVAKLLKSLTLLSINEIDAIMQQHDTQKHLRFAQKKLAETVVRDIHGSEKLEQAIKITNALFNSKITTLTLAELEMGVKNLDTTYISKSNLSLVDVLISANIASSKRVARELINNQSITINDVKIIDENHIFDISSYLYNKYLLIRKGKKHYFLVIYKNN